MNGWIHTMVHSLYNIICNCEVWMEHELFRMQRTGVSDAWMELDGMDGWMGDILSDGWMQCLFRAIADPEL